MMSRRPRIAAWILTVVALCSCGQNATPPNAGAPPSSAANAPANLAGTTWQLVNFTASDGKKLEPDDRSSYTITFNADGSLVARIDCNRGHGSWKSTAPDQLELKPLALTRAMCPPGSMHDRVAADWGAVRSYLVKDGHLYLSLMAAGGTYEYEPAPPQG